MFLFAAKTEVEQDIEEISQKVDNISKITDGLLDKIIAFGFSILIAIAIFIIGKIIVGLIRKFIKKIFNKSNVDIGVARFVDSLIKFAGYIIIFVTICAEVGIETTSFITLLGTAGLSIGLALQGCLSNFAGGVLILVTRPFKVGDYVVVDNVAEGVVERIEIIYTTLKTIDNKSVKIPNGTVAGSIITNVTHQTKRRVDVAIGIHYEDNIKKAKEIALEVMNNCQYILHEEDNAVVVKELAESSVIIEVRMWANTEDYWNAKFYLNEVLKESFENNGITIPYNQLDVHVHNTDK